MNEAARLNSKPIEPVPAERYLCRTHPQAQRTRSSGTVSLLQIQQVQPIDSCKMANFRHSAPIQPNGIFLRKTQPKVQKKCPLTLYLPDNLLVL
jgi:hypothetical protein